MTRKELAAKLRKVAQRAERFEATCDLESNDRSLNGVDYFFSCNEDKNACGYEFGCVYEAIFIDDAQALWEDHETCMPRRVLMLCFAAAMAETGDFIAPH